MEFGWKYIWKLYGWKKLFDFKNRCFYFSILCVLISTLAVFLYSKKEDDITILIEKIVDLGISMLPTLLGFNLGAYALIIGFLGNKVLLAALIEKQQNSSQSHLENLSSIFAVNIIIQAFSLLCSFLIKMFMGFEELDLNIFDVPNNFRVVFNYFIFVISSFFSLYSIVLVIQNVINIFDFSQLFIYFSMKKEE